MKKLVTSSFIAIFGFTPIFFKPVAQAQQNPAQQQNPSQQQNPAQQQNPSQTIHNCISNGMIGNYVKVNATESWKELIPNIEERNNLSAKVFKIQECGSNSGNGELSIEFIKAFDSFKFVRIIRDEYSRFYYENSNMNHSNYASSILTYSTSFPNFVIFGDYPSTDTIYNFNNFKNFYLDYIYSGNRSVISIEKIGKNSSEVRICVRSYQNNYCVNS